MNTRMTTPLTFALALGLALALLLPSPAPAQASGDARAEVDAAIARFAQARSFHASMSTDGDPPVSSQTDFVAPDRYRMTMPDGVVQVVVDGTMYIDGADGVRSIPVPPEVLARWGRRTGLTGLGAGMTATDLGEDVVDGASARKYGVSKPGEAAPSMTIWVGADGYPLQVRAGGNAGGQPVTTTIRYSRFNDPALFIARPE